MLKKHRITSPRKGREWWRWKSETYQRAAKKFRRFALKESKIEMYYKMLPPAAIPVAAPRASKRPTTRNGAFGMDSISSVTIPAWYRRYKTEKYTITYLRSKIERQQLMLVHGIEAFEVLPVHLPLVNAINKT